MSKKLIFNNQEEYAAAREEFFKNHPDAPEAKEIESLSLIMRREYAEAILKGKKPLEYRDYSKFYISRLIDKDVSNYIGAHINDDEIVMFCNDIRQVKKIHFHDYNNSWFLDIECDYNGLFSITKKDIEFLQKQYGAHDYDKDLARFERLKIKNRPFLFYFVMGKVIDTNLRK